MALLLLPAVAASRSGQHQLLCQHQHYCFWIPRKTRTAAGIIKSLRREEYPLSLLCNSSLAEGDLSDSSGLREISSNAATTSAEDRRSVWLEFVEDSATDCPDSVTSALRRYLFVTPDSDSARSPWMNRRSALLAVQNSNNLENALSRVGDWMESSDMNLLVRRFTNIGRWDAASQVLEWMVKKNKVTSATYSIYIVMLGRAGRETKASQVYDSLSQEYRLDPVIGNSMLGAFVNNWRVTRAFKLFEVLKEEGFVPNEITYSTMLSACMKVHDGYERSQDLLMEMRARKLKPDLYAYGSLLRVYCANGLEQQALSVVEEMKSQGLTLSTFHYSYLLNLYAHIKKPREAESLLAHIKDQGLQLDELVYHSMLRVYGRTGRVEEAKKLHDEIRESGFAFTMPMYTAMMEAYVTVRKVYEAHELLLEMRRNGVRPGGCAYSLLIAEYGKMKDLDMIKKLDVESRDRKKGKQDVRLFNSLLKAYSQVRYDDGITNTLQLMNFEGIMPDRGSFNILINHLCIQGMYGLALRTFKDMKARRLKPNMGTYSRLLTGLLYPLLRTPEVSSISQLLSAAESSRLNLLGAAYEIFREMQFKKVYCSQSAFENFIQANALARNWPIAMEAMECLDEAGFVPTKDLCEFLLVQACDDCHYASVREILNTISRQNYKLTKECLDQAKEVLSQLDQLKGVLGNL